MNEFILTPEEAYAVAGRELLEKDFDDISQYYEVEEVSD